VGNDGSLYAGHATWVTVCGWVTLCGSQYVGDGVSWQHVGDAVCESVWVTVCGWRCVSIHTVIRTWFRSR